MPFSKLWTPTTLSFGLALALCGCGPPERVVWVDVEAVIAQQESRVLSPALAAPLTASVSGSSVSVPAVPPSSNGRVAADRLRQEALAVVKAQLESTFEGLLRAYKRELTAKAKVTEQALRELLAERLRNASGQVAEQVSTIVAARADERGDMVVRLALLVGWPDLGGSAFIPVARTSEVKTAWEAESADLRRRLQVVDAAIENQIAGILSKEGSLRESEARIIAQQIKDAYASAEEEALRKAAQRVRATGRLDPPALLSRSGRGLSGQPGRSLAIPAVQTPSVQTSPVSMAAIGREAVIARLNIWLRNQGYKLAPGPKGVPDKTGEFIAWSRS